MRGFRLTGSADKGVQNGPWGNAWGNMSFLWGGPGGKAGTQSDAIEARGLSRWVPAVRARRIADYAG